MLEIISQMLTMFTWCDVNWLCYRIPTSKGALRSSQITCYLILNY